MSKPNLTGVDWTNPEEVKKYYRGCYRKPQVSERQRAYKRKYRERPEIKERRREYEHNPKVRQQHKDYFRKHVLKVNGKAVYGLNKRVWPGYCELCGDDSRVLQYHHWDKKNLDKGIWVCHYCHWLCEAVEKNKIHLADRYISFKKVLDEEINTKIVR